jgi:hypothetical protein
MVSKYVTSCTSGGLPLYSRNEVSMDIKTIAALAISGLAAVGATYGHSISPDDQTRIVTDLTDFASDLTIIMPIIAGIFHHLHVKKITNSTNPTSQKAS